jgi:flagellar basal body P-ring protein FlgI
MKFPQVLLLSGLCFWGGCSTWSGITSCLPWQSNEEKKEEAIKKDLLVGDLAVPYGLYPVKVEAVGLVTGLKHTGSDPKPGSQRQVLLGDMVKQGVASPNTLLASGNTSLVLVRGVIRPGIQKGDHFDLEVRVPSQSETTSLRGGWLMPVELREMQVMGDNQVHSGHVVGTAQGPLLVDPSAKGKADRVQLCRGIVLGGGVCKESRSVGLVLRNEKQSVRNASRIESAINGRFCDWDKGIKIGMAKAKTDQFIELKVHPRYKENTERYLQVIRSLPLKESEAQQAERIAKLEKELFDPPTSARAALELEAIGKPAADTLRKALKAGDPEVRFYAAESLAYLDETGEAEVLARLAKEQPAFRVFALGALTEMNDISASECLRDLLNVPSAETRYGAFRALWTMNPNDSLVMGEYLGGQFGYHVLNTSGPAMIHVTKSKRPEIVLFGPDQEFSTPIAVEAGNQIMVTGNKPGQIIVSRFAVREPDQKRFVSTRVDDVIRAIVALGGTYPDVVQALQEAKSHGCLASRFEMDALPEAGRVYTRQTGKAKPEDDADGTKKVQSDTPSDGATSSTEGADSADADKKAASADADSSQKGHPVRSFFAKMTGQTPPD